MDIRKIIKEEIGKILNEDYDFAGEEREYQDKMQNQEMMNGIVGADILNHFPFSELPNTRDEVDWDNREVSGWGKVLVPSMRDMDAQTNVVAKDDLTGREWQNYRTWKNNDGSIGKAPASKGSDEGFLARFKKAYGEEPVFVLDPNAEWHSKVKVVNPGFAAKRDDYVKRKGDALGEEKISDKIVDKKTMDTPTGTLFVMSMAENESKENNKRRD